LRRLADLNCKVTVVPYSSGVTQILALNPNGVLLSNGPGDPAAVAFVPSTVKALIEKKIPIFGICLGHQMLGLALGGKTYKLKFGHHGANQPVKDLRNGSIAITSQNHGYCVDINSLNKDDVEMTHVNLNDNTLEGMRHKRLPVLSVQYHPEAAPGPHDAGYLFEEFINLMKNA
jgi:carbamoyl-phosphate synthase small subunit